MALRCLLFSSDEGASQPVCQILAELGIEAEYCSVAVEAVEQVSKQSYQLVIADWENQPEATLLLNAARERKASERPLALAIVANDASVPPALQAGANSVLRKPIQENQARDTLTTAQGLLRTKMEPRPLAQAAAAGASSASPSESKVESLNAVTEKTLRAGEFLQSAPTPSTQFVTESEVPKTFEETAPPEIDPLAELEPMAAAVEAQEAAEPPAPPQQEESRGLSWYLKAKGVGAAAAPAPAPEAPTAKPELLGYSDAPAPSPPIPPVKPAEPSAHETHAREKKTEAALFAYISSGEAESTEPKPRRKIGKLPALAGLAAALAVAYFVVPQALWKPKAQAVIAQGARALHNWLNPQPKVTAPAPRSYESFARPGDEYKLPAAEAIPDATTDPSQIRVVPVVDPTAKHPNATNPTQDPAAVDTSPKDNPDPARADPGQSQQVPSSTPASTAPPQGSETVQTATPPSSTESQPQVQSPPPAPAHQEQPVNTPVVTPAPAHTAPQVTQAPRAATMPGNIPSSLRSQMATMTPDASGNKPVEAALPSIEPVELPEATARGLVLEQTEPTYPASAKGQQGTVVLQLLIGRDGAVQDAKFMQGSLAFARTAIDAVRQWHFKPYTLNTHPVSVRTVLTLHFKPGA